MLSPGKGACLADGRQCDRLHALGPAAPPGACEMPATTLSPPHTTVLGTWQVFACLCGAWHRPCKALPEGTETSRTEVPPWAFMASGGGRQVKLPEAPSAENKSHGAAPRTAEDVRRAQGHHTQSHTGSVPSGCRSRGMSARGWGPWW